MLPAGIAEKLPYTHNFTLGGRDLAIVGTANMDNRSFRLNFEVVAVMYDKRVAAQLSAVFEADVATANSLDATSLELPVALRKRLFASTARLFSPML